MGTGTIISMLGIGVCATIASKVLYSFGKAELASFIEISGLVGLGLITIGLIIDLTKALTML